MTKLLSLILGYLSDLLIGDPERLPHPVVGFGKLIGRGERLLNRNNHRMAKGALMAVTLTASVFAATWILLYLADSLSPVLGVVLRSVAVFFCLAGTTLIREVRQVFYAVDRSLDEGRRQVARIVGRDTDSLTAQEVRTAALETLSENLSDGVIAPLFWLAVFGIPGMMAYKMINTLDSMVGYRTERFLLFGRWAARIDDVANWLPARLTALLMLASTWTWRLLPTVWRNGRFHASPNSGYPEAALAAILDCQFGGPHNYFGQLFDKPYIGSNPREITTADMQRATAVNRRAELLMVIIVTAVFYAGCFI